MNIVIRDYSEISFTRRLDRIETSKLIEWFLFDQGFQRKIFPIST